MNFDFDAESLSPNASTVISLATTGAVQLPSGTTGEQPTATAGRLRWNTTAAELQFSDGSTWRGIKSGNSLAAYGITDAQPLNTDLTALAGLTSTGVVVRTGAGTAVTRSIDGTAGNITVTNGNGVAGNPTINLATAGTAGTYATVTTDAFGRVTSGVVTQTTATGGTGLTAIGTANQVLGVNAGASALEYKTITAGTNITVVHGVGTVTISATSGSGTPGGVNTNVQYNNGGAFGGNNAFNFVSGTNPYVAIQGTNENNMLRVGGSASLGNAHVYIEVNSTGAAVEGQRVYFNRNSAGINGWISYDYDGSAPNLRITDEDDDPPYVQFNTIGTGTYAAPEYTSVFGARGNFGGRDVGAFEGFAWHIGTNQNGFAAIAANAPVMELDRYWVRIPTGTTAQRPTGVNGMARYNSDTGSLEAFESANWNGLTGVIDKSVVTTTTTATGTTAFTSFSVPGGTLGTNRMLRIRAGGTWQNTSGGGRVVTLSISYGGTIWSDASATLSSSNIVGWHLDVILLANNSATAQQLNGLVHIGGTGSVGTGTTGNLSSDEILGVAVISGSGSVDSASAQTLTLNTAFSGGTISWQKHYHIIELL